MNSAEMMKRCENAVRTGQTEHLFPVLARRTLELIREDKRRNRSEWAGLHPYWMVHVVALNLNEMGQTMMEVVAPAYRAAEAMAVELSKALGLFAEAFNAPRR